MEPEKILILGLGFIILAGITLFVSFKFQSRLKSVNAKNAVNIISFMLLAIVSIMIFKSYSQGFISALNN